MPHIYRMASGAKLAFADIFLTFDLVRRSCSGAHSTNEYAGCLDLKCMLPPQRH